jgi:nicotinate-nucleotide adenylyltransferase
MARASLDTLRLDRLVWMPTGNPKYRERAIAAPAHRLAMLRLALAGEPRYVIDERELSAEATGYTVDSLHAMQREYGGDAVFYLIMGGDQYAKLDSWHRPEEVKRLAKVAVAGRPGFHSKDLGAHVIPMPPLTVSGSDIRARVARGEDIASLVPAAVANYIRREGLYT